MLSWVAYVYIWVCAVHTPWLPHTVKKVQQTIIVHLFFFFLHLFSQKCLFAKNTKFFHRVFVVVCTSPCYCIFLPTCVYERMSECVCMDVVCSKKKNLSSYSPRPQVDGKMHCKLQCNVANIVEQKIYTRIVNQATASSNEFRWCTT